MKTTQTINGNKVILITNKTTIDSTKHTQSVESLVNLINLIDQANKNGIAYTVNLDLAVVEQPTGPEDKQCH